MAIRLTSCSGSLEEEDWKDRLEEEEESMAAEEGFLFADSYCGAGE
jgi:hypothetical protein